VKMQRLRVETKSRDQVVLVRRDVEEALRGLGAGDGLCHLWCPHTTAAVSVNEGADPDVARDFLARLDEVVPWEAGYRHAEGNAAAHIKAVLVGPSVTVAVEDGRLALGTWQDVYFCEFDGPRRRTLEVRFLPG
jgi:secondary thiamine-phosphate synthase enzyme